MLLGGGSSKDFHRLKFAPQNPNVYLLRKAALDNLVLDSTADHVHFYLPAFTPNTITEENDYEILSCS